MMIYNVKETFSRREIELGIIAQYPCGISRGIFKDLAIRSVPLQMKMEFPKFT